MVGFSNVAFESLKEDEMGSRKRRDGYVVPLRKDELAIDVGKEV